MKLSKREEQINNLKFNAGLLLELIGVMEDEVTIVIQEQDIIWLDIDMKCNKDTYQLFELKKRSITDLKIVIDYLNGSSVERDYHLAHFEP